MRRVTEQHYPPAVIPIGGPHGAEEAVGVHEHLVDGLVYSAYHGQRLAVVFLEEALRGLAVLENGEARLAAVGVHIEGARHGPVQVG